MAVLAQSNITIPKNMAAGLWSKVTTGSVLAKLSGREPQKFGQTDIMTFTTPPRAEFVGEGAQKGASSAAFGLVSVTPKKAHVTMRFNEEVLWADEEYQLGVLQTVTDASALALARALDLGAIHRINPLTGTASTVITSGTQLNATTNRVEVATAPDTEVESAAGLVIANGYIPNGIAFDPKYAWTLATARYSDGRSKYPELGFGTDINNFRGLPAAVSTTVSATPEATDTKLRGLVGDFTTFHWGIQKTIPVELIRFGDPDGQGDLKRNNQVALRSEIVYGWVAMDLLAFAALNDLV